MARSDPGQLHLEILFLLETQQVAHVPVARGSGGAARPVSDFPPRMISNLHVGRATLCSACHPRPDPMILPCTPLPQVFGLLPLCLLRSFNVLSYASLLGVGGILYTAVFMSLRLFEGSYVPGGEFYEALVETGATAVSSFNLRGTSLLKSVILISTLTSSYLCHYNAPKFLRELKDATVERSPLPPLPQISSHLTSRSHPSPTPPAPLQPKPTQQQPCLTKRFPRLPGRLRSRVSPSLHRSLLATSHQSLPAQSLCSGVCTPAHSQACGETTSRRRCPPLGD